MGTIDLPQELRDEIREELNVKDVDWNADLTGKVYLAARPNPAILGPRYGKDFLDLLP